MYLHAPSIDFYFFCVGYSVITNDFHKYILDEILIITVCLVGIAFCFFLAKVLKSDIFDIRVYILLQYK